MGGRSQADAASYGAAPLPKSFARACGCRDAKGAAAPSSMGMGRVQRCRWVHTGKWEADDLGGPSDLCKGGFKKAGLKAQCLTKHYGVPLNM